MHWSERESNLLQNYKRIEVNIAMQLKANHDWYQRRLAPTGIQLITADPDYCEQIFLPIGAWVQFIKLTT